MARNFGDGCGMTRREGVIEICAVCGVDASDGRWFCHFYHPRSRVTLCSPACAETYLRQPDGEEGHRLQSRDGKAEPARIFPSGARPA